MGITISLKTVFPQNTEIIGKGWFTHNNFVGRHKIQGKSKQKSGEICEQITTDFWKSESENLNRYIVMAFCLGFLGKFQKSANKIHDITFFT